MCHQEGGENPPPPMGGFALWGRLRRFLLEWETAEFRREKLRKSIVSKGDWKAPGKNPGLADISVRGISPRQRSMTILPVREFVAVSTLYK